MGSGLKLGKSPILGLPIDPITAKLNNAIGLGPEEVEPPAITPPPTLPTRSDPSVEDARRRERQTQARRRGRAASVIAPPESSLGEPNISRPQLRGAAVLGQTA